MPYKNVVKNITVNSWYHVYNRVAEGLLFQDDEDKQYFYSLLQRYFGSEKIKLYPNYHLDIYIVCYCLMPNHFHLLVYVKNPSSLKQSMRSLFTSYVKYYHKKHKRRGQLFESNYKASWIDSDGYLKYIVRYIHHNPSDWLQYKDSSYVYMHAKIAPDWLNVQLAEQLFESKKQYLDFMADLEESALTANLLLPFLANR